MIVLGLTGSIGMGKSTTAQMFRDEGVPVWDADAAVHRLYGPGGLAVAPLQDLVPEAVGAAGVDRGVLKAKIAEDATLLGRIEKIVHPLVAEDRAMFLDAQRTGGTPVVVLDVPLLFEAGGARDCDRIVVVSVPEAEHRARVLARPGMTEADFERILARQMPDAEKRDRADFVIDTKTIEGARAQVRAVLDAVREGGDA